MKVAVIKEAAPGERRVALVPEAVAKLRTAGIEVLVESGAGDQAWFADGAYAEAGASIVSGAEIAAEADVIFMVGRPDEQAISRLRPGQAVFGMLAPLTDPALADRLAATGATAISLPDPADAVADAGHGCAVVPGQYRRLQSGRAGGGHVRPVFPAADHGGGHGPAGPGAGARDRGLGTAGDRNGPAARCRGDRLRRAAGDED